MSNDFSARLVPAVERLVSAGRSRDAVFLLMREVEQKLHGRQYLSCRLLLRDVEKRINRWDPKSLHALLAITVRARSMLAPERDSMYRAALVCFSRSLGEKETHRLLGPLR